MAKIFDGVRVLDFTDHVSGPTATAAMADLGAEVIKIEPPGRGDSTRSLSPKLDGQALNFLWNNRGKKSITVSLKDPDGLKVIRELLPTADVIVENFRPGVMKRLGLGYEAVIQYAPQIIYCSISGFGQTGPDAMRPGFDIIVQAKSGIMDLTGEPDGSPTKIGLVVGDMVTGKDTFGAISAALYHKLKTGEGQYIDVSMLECMTSMNLYIDHVFIGKNPQRRGRHHISLAPYGIFEGKNGQCVVIAAYTDKHWATLCNGVLKRPELVDDPRFVSPGSRTENYKEIAVLLETWLKQYDNINDALRIMEGLGLVCGKICSTQEVTEQPQLIARDAFVDIEPMPSMKNAKTFKARGPWIKYSKTPAGMKRACELGEHNYEIMGELGLSKEQVDALEEKWLNSMKK
jgi:Predicted acyl-CoA transferases/carnitine dehydratase